MTQDLDALLDRRQLKRRLNLWRVSAIVLIAVVLMLAFGSSSQVSGPHIARVKISGIILDDLKREAMLDAIAEDDDVKALVVRINSPGGSVAGSEALYERIREVAAKKPVTSVMATLAASGGYLTAMATDHIVARQTTITGSIGVLYRSPHFAGLFETVGIGVNEVKSDPVKAGASIYTAMSEETRAVYQRLIDDSYEWFLDIVVERRGMERPRAMGLADGSVYMGRRALANGLIDALGNEKTALEWLESERDIPKGLPVVDYSVKVDSSRESCLRLGRRLALVSGSPLTGCLPFGNLDLSCWRSAYKLGQRSRTGRRNNWG